MFDQAPSHGACSAHAQHAHLGERLGEWRQLLQQQQQRHTRLAEQQQALQALQMLARQEDPDTLFFNRELEITGDTELGLIVKNMLDAIEWPQLSAKLPLLRH